MIILFLMVIRKSISLGRLEILVQNVERVSSIHFQDPEKTAENFHNDGWWRTGDLGRVREDGCMAIEGRSKDMIIRGGENIQPTEIENFFVTHPKIHQCYVIGVPSARLGEEVAAYIKVRF